MANPHGYQPIPLPAQPPKRKLSTGAIVAIVIGSVVVLICGICTIGAVVNGALFGDRLKSGSGPAATTTNGQHTIRFEVTAADGAKATLINWSTLEDSALLNDEPLPWSKEVTLETKLGLVGVNASVASGRVGCKLYVDGQLVDEGESDVVVNCSDTVR